VHHSLGKISECVVSRLTSEFSHKARLNEEAGKGALLFRFVVKEASGKAMWISNSVEIMEECTVEWAAGDTVGTVMEITRTICISITAKPQIVVPYRR
jgi:hypothetical protein